MKSGYKVEINVKQASTLGELLNQVKGVHGALQALVNAGAALQDLRVGDYSSNMTAQVLVDPVYEPGDVKYSYGTYSYRIDEEGHEIAIEPTEFVARRLARLVNLYIEADPDLAGTEELIQRAYTNTELPSSIQAVVSTERVEHMDTALKISSETSPESWIVTGIGEIIKAID